MAKHVVITTVKGIEYVRVCESYRNSEGKPRSRTVESHGRRSLLTDAYIQALRERVDKENKKLREARLSGLEKSAQERIDKLTKMLNSPTPNTGFRKFNIGVALINHVWKDLALPKLFHNLQSAKCEYNYERLSFLLAAARLINPRSKQKTFEWREQSIVPISGVTDNNQIYRVLDRLAENKKSIVRYLNREIDRKIDRKITAAFYDVTTYAFESQQESEMKGFGISKDHKVNEVQVVLGLVMDEDGIPLDYELFNGSTNEFGTMVPIIKRLKSQYKIDKLVVVADRGLNSAENLLALKDIGCDFVIAQKIKNCESEEKKAILRDDNWKTVNISEDGEVLIKYKTLPTKKIIYETKISEKTGKKYQTKNVLDSMDVDWLVSYSSKRAHKDIKDLERAIEKAKQALEKNHRNPVKSKGYKAFITLPRGEGSACLDLQKIEEARRWVGYYAICTSLKAKTEEELMGIYRTLWRIEDCFRVSKTQLESRPCYVWTDAHIQGHFVSCYVSLVLEKYMEYVLKGQLGKDITTEKMFTALREAEVVYDNSSAEAPVFLRLYQPDMFDRISKVFGLNPLCQIETPQGVRTKLHLRNLGV